MTALVAPRRALLLGVAALGLPPVLAQPPRSTPTPAPTQVLRVGPRRELRSLAAAARVAREGMRIEVDAGDYPGDAAVWRADGLQIVAVGGRVRLPAQGAHAEGKGLFVTAGENISIEGLDFSGVRVPDSNGAGIRLERGSLFLRDCSFRDCEMGLLTSNHPDVRLALEGCEFSHAAPRPGGAPAHLLYAGRIAHLRVQGCYFHHGRVGHLLKSRAAVSEILYNRLTDESGGRASYELEFPDGGLALVLGNLIQQSAGSENPHLIAYGAESLLQPRRELYLLHNTLVDNLPGGGRYLRVPAGQVRVQAYNNLLVGGGRLAPDAAWDWRNNPAVDWEVFERAAREDFRPRPGSGLRDRVIEPAPLADGRLPRLERQYQHPRQSVALSGPPRYPGAFQP
ncbi:UNVERIFIED_ORG: hypothetical protein LHJ69_05090 [Shinella sp. XGS7]|nr:hypothetical protein [Shinella sp. XGS7]